jgi:hypothetical protein
MLVLPAALAFAACSSDGRDGAPGTGAQSSAVLSAIGPIGADGFPAFYQDTNGLALTHCFDFANPLCGLVVGDIPNPALPVSFPGNYPADAVYWDAVATMDTNNAGKAELVFSVTQAFLNGPVVPGDQITFSRIRVRVDNLVAGATYRVTHPYGVDTFVATGTGRRGINVAQDVGGAAGDFATALTGRVGPFLTWSPPASAPAGFVGDPAVPHVVTGSPFGTNIFRIEGPNVGAPGSPFLCQPANTTNCIQTNLFALRGKIANAAPPVATLVANAGPDQIVRAGQTVTLDGSRSLGATAFAWSQTAGTPVVTLQGAATAMPTFVFPAQPATLTFQLVVTGASGSTATDTVQVSAVNDRLSAVTAQFRTTTAQWRVNGSALAPAPNVVTIHLGSTLAGPVLGTAAVDALGLWSFRSTGGRSAATVSIESSAGAQLLAVPVTVRN